MNLKTPIKQSVYGKLVGGGGFFLYINNGGNNRYDIWFDLFDLCNHRYDIWFDLFDLCNHRYFIYKTSRRDNGPGVFMWAISF